MAVPCSCPWCTKEVEPGCFSITGQPTCSFHSARRVLKTLAEAEEMFGGKKDSPESKKEYFTVVVEMSPEDAQHPGVPTMAYLVSTPNSSEMPYDAFRQAAKEGRCQIRMFTVPVSDVTTVVHRLKTYGATRLE